MFDGYGFEGAGLKDVAEEINNRYGNSFYFEDDGEWYEDWKEFKIGNSISWSTIGDHKDGDPQNAEEAITEFFDGMEERLKEEMTDRFGKVVDFKLREPLHIFVDNTIAEFRPNHVGFYGWLSVVVNEKEL